MKRIGHDEAVKLAEALRNAFGSRVGDGMVVSLGDVKNVTDYMGYNDMVTTNLLLRVIFTLLKGKQTTETEPKYIVKDVDEPDNNWQTVDLINNPSHYNVSGIECIDEMILAFGHETTKAFCVCNAWKYRYRAGHKDGSSRSDDLEKANRYMKYAKVIEKYKDPLSPCYSYLPVSTLADRLD